MLARRRVVGALRQRLDEAEQKLQEQGMAEYADGRQVYVWDWPLIERLHAWLNSYLGHFRRASTRRLIVALRQRYYWLDEYFQWYTGRIVLRCPIPRNVIRFCRQKQRFAECLPGHLLVVRVGNFWEMMPGPFQDMTETWERMGLLNLRFPQLDIDCARQLLWRAGVAVAWIEETGRRISAVNERALARRWTMRC